ncbi:MAG: glycosyltransferase family 87 protein [Haloplanus sp.]
MSALRRLLALRTRRPAFVTTSLVVLTLLVAYPFVDAALRHLHALGHPRFDWVAPFHFNDFGAYATAIARWQSDHLVYWRNPEGGFFGTYLYPPVYLLVFLPWVALGGVDVLPLTPFETAALLFELCSLLALWLGLQLVARVSGLRLAWYDRLLGLVALVGFQPLLFSMKLGQVSALVAAGFCFAYATMAYDPAGRWGRTAQLASGALTAAVAGIKPYYATAGTHLLCSRTRLTGAVGGGVALLALSVGVFGVENHVEYLTVLSWGKGWGTRPSALSAWHPGYFEPLFVIGRRFGTATVLIRLGLLVGVAVLAVLTRDADVRRETFALGLAVYPLAAPEVYTQDFVALLLVAGVLVEIEFERPRGHPTLPVVAVGLLGGHAYGLAFLVFPLPDVVPFGDAVLALAPLLQPGLWGTLLLFGLSALRVAEPLDPGATLSGIRDVVSLQSGGN